MFSGLLWAALAGESARTGVLTSPIDSAIARMSALMVRLLIRYLPSVEELAADRRSAGRTALSSRAVFVTGR
jgi:hypothetical protein